VVKEKNVVPVDVKMHLREQREDVGQPVLLVKITREEVGNLRSVKQEHSIERKRRVFTVGLKGGVR